MNTLPNKLLALRKKYAYSQNYVAEQLKIDVLEYMGYENGRAVPKFETLKMMADLFKVDVDILFDNTKHLETEEKVIEKIDKQNSNYLTKQTKKENFNLFINKNKKKLIVGGVVLVLVIVLVVVGVLYYKNSHTERNTMVDKASNRLDASDTSVVKLDTKGFVSGSGDNSSGQLNFNFDDVFKVRIASNFTAALTNDGKVSVVGVTGGLEGVEKWKDIIDIETGYNHILALDRYGKVYCASNNSSKACDISSSVASDIFASGNASFIVMEDKTIKSYGDFMGRSKIDNLSNIRDIESNSSKLAYIDHNGKLIHFTSDNTYIEVGKWENLVDVEIGDNYIAAIDNKGQVYIETSDELMKKQVEAFKDIKAIAGGRDYLVGFDGLKIHGAGNNAYGQFEKNQEVKLSLASVENVNISLDEENLIITFDEVPNASGYLVKIDDRSKETTSGKLMIALDNLEDNHEYVIQIIAKGNEEYEDSKVVSINYLLKKPVKDRDVTIDTLEGMTKEAFETYLLNLGIDANKFIAIESDEVCTGDQPIILEVHGIRSNVTYKESELKQINITYKYCKFDPNITNPQIGIEGDIDEDMAN